MIGTKIAYGHNVICAVACFLHCAAMVGLGESKIKDVREAYKEEMMFKHGKTLV